MDNLGGYYQPDDKEELIKSIQYFFEDFVWVTEISIPEMFWTNHLKIGDILTDPITFNKNPEKAIRYLHLPGFVCFISSQGKITDFEIIENDRKYPLLVPKCNKCFIQA